MAPGGRLRCYGAPMIATRLFSPKVQVHGLVTPGFEKVADAFRENFRLRNERGASFCAYVEGEKVIDIWGGEADEAGRPWREDTISTLFSATKGLAALTLLLLADRGQLDYDAPVQQYWPEFGLAGVTVRTLLNHRSGLLSFAETIRLGHFEHEPERVASALGSAKPFWEPGTDQGYHGVTYGVLAAELFRRVAGRSMGSFLAEEVAGPLKADVFLGLPAIEERRVATMFPAPTSERLSQMVPKIIEGSTLEGRVYRAGMNTSSATATAFRDPAELGALGLHNYNSRRVHRLELPWANGIGNARGLARAYAPLAGDGSFEGVELVRPETLLPLRERQSWVENDRVLCKPMGWAQGFIKEETKYFSPNPEAFGHPGAGGTLGFADPVKNVSIGYVMNQMSHCIRSPRAVALCHALYDCL